MFWRFGGYANISSLDTILDKPDVSLEELLDESDLIQELKQQNSKLIEFLRDDDRLEKLLKYVVADQPLENFEESKEGEEEEKSTGISFFGKGKARARSKSASKPDGETEQEKKEVQRKKYAYVACEVLSSEVWSITEALLENRAHLKEFWEYMRRPAPLDPLQAGYFTKVNEALLDKKTEGMLSFFKSLNGIVPAMLQHVDCPMVMDLLLKIISLEKHEGGQGIVDWLQTQDLIPLLLGYLSTDHNSATQTSAGDFLKAIITISANATTQDQSVIGPNELTRQLVSQSCIDTLIRNMLLGGNPLTVGVGIIIEVIRKNNSDYDLDNQVDPDMPKTSDPIYLGTLLRTFAKHVPDFMELIRSPRSKKDGLKVAFGGKIEPLGFDRFKTCELMAELLHCSNMGLLNERGSEEEVNKRDAERERLKAEGKLATPRAPSASGEEFGSSVDSHGFHHAQKPSDDSLDEPEEEVKRLEVQNASDEDGFEKVQNPDELPDEVTFDEFNEKADEAGLPFLERSEKRNSQEVKPLSPTKPNLHFDPPPTEAAADSPTSAGVTDRLAHTNMNDDGDTVMSELGPEEEPAGKQHTLLIQQMAEEQPLSFPEDDSPGGYDPSSDPTQHADLAPPPLFARKDPPAADEVDPVLGKVGGSEELDDVDQSVATIQGEQQEEAAGERGPYETEADGSPVVGDLLKMQFVEHQVVPTILDFFFRFPWNNFLHNVVYDVVQQVFNGTLDRGYNKALAFDLFTQAIPPSNSAPEYVLGLVSTKDITDRILDGQKTSDASQTGKGMRLGYMGHLTLIAEEVCKFGSRHPPEVLKEHILERVSREDWVRYVEGTLAETRDKDNAVLGGVRPENAMGVRQMGMGGAMQSGFSSNSNSQALSNAGLVPADTLALQEGTVGQSYEINAGTMLSGFGDGDDDDEEMEEARDEQERDRRESGGSAHLDDDEQVGELSFDDVDMDYR